MSILLRGLLVYAGAFLALELPARYLPGCPWPTLSATVRGAIAWWHPVATLVAVVMVVLLGHFEAHWRVRWLLLAAGLGAASIVLHLVWRD